ncbi:MAG TPA: serine hydrolase domain-containing protein, partial [Bryobacteraceae bacterium]|nr:serine hydrolase domain-containing protein [Bryobacteraceae bacterium]
MEKRYRIQEVLQRAVDRGDLAGAAAAVWRDGSFEAACAGWRDIEERLPVEIDTIFRIASMTKPIASVAALMLMDEGKISLHEPISKYAPEFSDMRVLKSPDGPLDETEPSARPITFEHLLTHRAGLTYADFHRGPIVRAYCEALGRDIDSDIGPDEWMRRLAGLPLIGQPDSAMYYGKSTDLLGFLIARIEGSSLGHVLQRRIFGPLGMKDTGFTVPPEKHHRRSAAHGFDDAGRLIKRAAWGSAPGDPVVPERPENMAYESGSGGLWSTAGDYLKFARL